MFFFKSIQDFRNRRNISPYLKIKNYQFKDLNNLTKMFHDLLKNRDFTGLEKLENYKLKLNYHNKINSGQIKKELAKIEINLNQVKKGKLAIIR